MHEVKPTNCEKIADGKLLARDNLRVRRGKKGLRKFQPEITLLSPLLEAKVGAEEEVALVRISGSTKIRSDRLNGKLNAAASLVQFVPRD